MLSVGEFSKLPFEYSRANSFLHGNPLAVACLFGALDNSSAGDPTNYPSGGCFLAPGAL